MKIEGWEKKNDFTWVTTQTVKSEGGDMNKNTIQIGKIGYSSPYKNKYQVAIFKAVPAPNPLYKINEYYRREYFNTKKEAEKFAINFMENHWQGV